MCVITSQSQAAQLDSEVGGGRPWVFLYREEIPGDRPPPPLRTGSPSDEHSLESSTRDREQAGGDGARPAMVSESIRGGADRTTAAGEEKEERGQLLFDVPEIRFTKLFINGSFVDAVSGTCTVLPSLAPTPVQNSSLLPITTESIGPI